MKKGICIGTVPGGLSDDGFALAKEAGFDGIELGTMNDGETRAKAAALAKKHALAVPSIMNAVHWGKPLSDPDPDVRKASVEGMLASFASAEATGAETVLLVPAGCDRSGDLFGRLDTLTGGDTGAARCR